MKLSKVCSLCGGSMNHLGFIKKTEEEAYACYPCNRAIVFSDGAQSKAYPIKYVLDTLEKERLQ